MLDKQRGSHTDRLRPVGSSGLVPIVEIEFSANDKFYRIRKRFSRQQASSEAALLQTFPKYYKILDPNTPFIGEKIAKHIGNAVPVELGRVIARSIKKHIGS